MRSRIAFILIVLFLFVAMPALAQTGEPLPLAPQQGVPIPTPGYQPTWQATAIIPPSPVPTWTPIPTRIPPIFYIQLYVQTWIYDCPSFACMHEPAASTQPGDQCWPVVPARAATLLFFQVQGDCWFSGRYIDRTQVTIK